LLKTTIDQCKSGLRIIHGTHTVHEMWSVDHPSSLIARPIHLTLCSDGNRLYLIATQNVSQAYIGLHCDIVKRPT